MVKDNDDQGVDMRGGDGQEDVRSGDQILRRQKVSLGLPAIMARPIK